MKNFKVGTVGWLQEKLVKFPPDEEVLIGINGVYYNIYSVDVKLIREGHLDEENGESTVCIKGMT